MKAISLLLSALICCLPLGCFASKGSYESQQKRIAELEKQNQALMTDLKQLNKALDDRIRALETMKFEVGLLRQEVMRKGEPKTETATTAEQINALIKQIADANADINGIAEKLPALGKGAIVAVIETLKSPDVGYRSRLEKVLSLMPTNEVVPVLNSTLKDKTLRVSSARVLGSIKDKSAVPALAECLTDNDDDFCFEVAQALIKLKDKRGIPVLIDTLKNDDQPKRAMAINTLSELTGQTFDYKHYAPLQEQEESVKKWEEWWMKNGDAFVFPQ
ncbi:MAG: HEAT repeat domain-containing protein [Planctomycetes bacterium]|nr:HEAT repeat domain-containing protein [Planctomycetota bacterium]